MTDKPHKDDNSFSDASALLRLICTGKVHNLQVYKLEETDCECSLTFIAEAAPNLKDDLYGHIKV